MSDPVVVVSISVDNISLVFIPVKLYCIYPNMVVFLSAINYPPRAPGNTTVIVIIYDMQMKSCVDQFTIQILI